MHVLKIAALSSVIGLASCNSVPTVTGCSQLAESILMTPTPHAVVTATTTPEDYGLAETGQLNKANDDKATGFRVIRQCEVRDEEIRRSLSRPFWQFW